MLNFIRGVFGLVQAAIVLVLILSYTYGVAKFSAQAGINANGNPLKQKILKTTLGVEPPEGELFGLDLKALAEGRCEPRASQEKETGNIFLLSLLDVLNPNSTTNQRTTTSQENKEIK